MAPGSTNMRTLLKCLTMIDNIKGSFVTNDPDYIKREVCNYNRIKSAYGKEYYTNNPTAEKMLFRYDPETHLVVFKNSIHKRYKNNNYTDFSKKEIKLSVHQLCDHLKIKDDQLVKILEIEIGVNIEVVDVSTILKRLHSHKNKPFRWLPKSKRRLDDWGKKATHTDYEIKMYDKKLQESLVSQRKKFEHPFDRLSKEYIEDLHFKSQSNLLRYEMHFKRVGTYLPSINNLHSLYNDKCLLEVKEHLIRNLHKIDFKTSYNTEGLKPKDAQAIFCYENEDYFDQFILDATPQQRKSYKRTYENIKSKINVADDLKSNLINLVDQKIHELVN